VTQVQFQPAQCLFNDPAGWGLLLLGHALEHEDFRVACLGLSTPIVIPDYNLRSWRDEPEFVQNWLVNHEQIHEALRAVTGVGGDDLSLVDLSQEDEFYIWLQDHDTEHQSFRQVLGTG
jgi:hypothetical protein